MSHEVLEHALACPYCGETITMLVEPGPGAQDYIEDCEVCCNPIGIRLSVEDGVVVTFEARALDG